MRQFRGICFSTREMRSIVSAGSAAGAINLMRMRSHCSSPPSKEPPPTYGNAIEENGGGLHAAYAVLETGRRDAYATVTWSS